MVPSSTLCRTQESLHRRRAADTPLQNVRAVETAAAMAWGREAEAAERRERRHQKVIAIAADAVGRTVTPEEFDLLLSENPDRAMAAL